jgi:tetratricopeptide (TPR) repeat protein
METTDADFAKLIAAPPEYRPPELIDDDFAMLIANRGSARAKVCIRNTWMLFLLFVPVGFFAGLTNCNLVLIALGAVAICGWAIAALKVATVSRAFKNQLYGKTAALLPSAMRWSAIMYPFTVFQLARCQTIEFQMLLSEARWIELEILSRFLWAVSERTPIISGTPKNWALANNLAVAWMLQGKYAEAARLFATKISSVNTAGNRLVLLNNLAFCQARDKQLDAAETTLNQAFSLLGNNTSSDVSPRLRYIRALVQIERGQLDEAEHSLDEAVAIGHKQKVAVELQAACTALLAQLRHKQGRREESELHFRNAIDMLSKTDNPQYIGLAQYLHYFAQLQMDMGNIQGARQSLEKARSYYDYYVTREESTVSSIKEHLMNEKKLCTTTTLLKLANREPLLEMRN